MRKTLDELLTIGGVATKINLYSQEAKTQKGSMLQINKTLNVLMDRKFVTRIEPSLPGRSKWRETFYRITLRGATFIGRKDDYIYKGDKNPKDIIHQSNVNDITLSFLRNFPDYEIDFEFNKKLPFVNKRNSHIESDIFVRVKKGKNEYVFFVEMERKNTASRILDKVKLYDKLLAELDFGKYRIPKQVKVLIIYSNRIKDISLFRPQEYNLVQEQITSLEDQIKFTFGHFSDRYRVTTFNNFHRLHEPVWYNSKGELVKIIN